MGIFVIRCMHGSYTLLMTSHPGVSLMITKPHRSSQTEAIPDVFQAPRPRDFGKSSCEVQEVGYVYEI